MESTSQKNHDPKSNEKEEHRSNQKTLNKFKGIISNIPKKQGVWVFDLYQYEGFWGDFLRKDDRDLFIISRGVLSKIKTDDKRLMREGEKGHLESVAE